VTILADPETIMVAHLTSILADRPEVYAQGVTVSVDAPVVKTGEVPGPRIQVEDDGTPAPRWPMTNAATVRVTCWASSRATSKQLGALVQSLVCGRSAPAGAWSVKQLTGPLRGYDDTLKMHFASLTFRVSTRPVG
jgi:hypothetical protein